MATPTFSPSDGNPSPWPGGPGQSGGYPTAAFPGYPAAPAQPMPPGWSPEQMAAMQAQTAAPGALLFAPTEAVRRAQEGNPRFTGRHKSHKTEHRDVTGGALRATVFGAMDGLVTNASLIAGASGANATTHSIILTGLAGLVAGAFSMATGEYISVTSQNEMTIAEVDAERIELAHNPRKELAELAQLYVAKGVDPRLALEVAAQLSQDPEQAVNVHAREELGVDPDDLPSPWTAAGSSFAAFTVGALIPLAPFLLGLADIVLALGLAGAAALIGGALVAKAANRPPVSGGIRQFALGALATGMTFFVGTLVGGGHVG